MKYKAINIKDHKSPYINHTKAQKADFEKWANVVTLPESRLKDFRAEDKTELERERRMKKIHKAKQRQEASWGK